MGPSALGDHEPGGTAGGGPPPPDDIRDLPEDPDRWPRLAGPLRVCAEVVGPAFREVDEKALRHQWYHRLLTKLAAVFGTAAIVFAILQLAFADAIGASAMAVSEVAAGILAGLAVALGLLVAFQKNWLVKRNQAERLRMARYRYLIDPDLWAGDPAAEAACRERLEEEVRAITATGIQEVHHWVGNDSVPSPPPNVLGLDATTPAGEELIAFYRARRLRYQLDFFGRRAEENRAIDQFTRYLSPVLFFGSVGAALVHFGYDILKHADRLDTFSRWMIVLAAALPVLGGAIRTLRSAYEFSRNTYRYRAKAVALETIVTGLDHVRDPRSRFLALWVSEQTLENEHREWLRLMLEAEWFA